MMTRTELAKLYHLERWIDGLDKEPLSDYLDRSGLNDCIACQRFGVVGEDLSFYNDNEYCVCSNCLVSVFGWTNDGRYLEVETYKGNECWALIDVAKGYGDQSGLDYWNYVEEGENDDNERT